MANATLHITFEVAAGWTSNWVYRLDLPFFFMKRSVHMCIYFIRYIKLLGIIGALFGGPY